MTQQGNDDTNGGDPAAAGADFDALAQAHQAVAAAQNRSYWLDRWGIDLNAAMRRPAGRRAREAVRLLRSVRRAAIEARRAATAQLGEVRTTGLDEGDAEVGPAPRGVPIRRLRAAPATDVLFARLSDGDVAAVERAADTKHSTQLTGADAEARRRLLLALGAEWQVGDVAERIGLMLAPDDGDSDADPWLARTAGALYGADVVADALATGGIDLSAGARVLGFDRDGDAGVASVLESAYPECEWRGCDPVAPPFDVGDAEFDAAYALTAWVRLPPDRTRAWLEELRRVVRPGGVLVLVARGRHSVARAYDGRDEGAGELAEVDAALNWDGVWHGRLSVAGDGPDEVTFMTPEWLIGEATPLWSIAELAPGRVDNDRDVYVLVRR